MTTNNNAEIKIYVANLGKYNEGELVGEWFTLPVEWDEVKEAIGLNAQYEEHAIHDYEAPFEISEYANIEKLNEWAEALESNPVDEDVFKGIYDLLGDVEQTIEVIENNEYSLYYDCVDMADVAHEVIEQNGMLDGVADNIARYFDYESFGRDLEIEGSFSYIGNKTYLELHR